VPRGGVGCVCVGGGGVVVNFFNDHGSPVLYL
jgi:hypothetical protein